MANSCLPCFFLIGSKCEYVCLAKPVQSLKVWGVLQEMWNPWFRVLDLATIFFYISTSSINCHSLLGGVIKHPYPHRKGEHPSHTVSLTLMSVAEQMAKSTGEGFLQTPLNRSAPAQNPLFIPISHFGCSVIPARFNNFLVMASIAIGQILMGVIRKN